MVEPVVGAFEVPPHAAKAIASTASNPNLRTVSSPYVNQPEDACQNIVVRH